jgi:hypothetical protein
MDEEVLDFSGTSPPPVPPRQIKQMTLDASTKDAAATQAPCKALDLSMLSPPVPPYSPEWARPSTLASSPAPLSPMAASAQQQKSIAAAVAAAAKGRKVGRQWSRVPVTNLSSLMNRPLPETPKPQPKQAGAHLSLSLSPSSSDDSTAPMPDKQAPGAIVVSPRHSGRHGLEPKEDDDGGGSFASDKLPRQEQQQQAELESGVPELDSLGQLEAQCAEEQQRCCSCNEALQPNSALWQLEQSYCRRCFVRSQCSCTVCAYAIEAGQSFVSLQGTEESADLQVRVAPPQDEMVRLRLRRRGDATPEALLYHASCLSCSAPSHAPAPLRSPGSESMDEQLAALEARWFHHRGRIYCMHDYLLMHGTNCAQCRQIITVRFGKGAERTSSFKLRLPSVDPRRSHFRMSFGVRVALCLFLCQGGGVRALKQDWHASCFMCAGECGRVLSPGKFYLAPAQFVSPPLSPARATSPIPGLKANKSVRKGVKASSASRGRTR